MKRENKTQSIAQMFKSDVFCKLMGQNKLNSVLKHSAIFSFWSAAVGSKFACVTKPYAIKGARLYVSAKSSVISQELSLYKSKILNKLNSYSKPLGIELNDIIYNYKNYSVSVPKMSENIGNLPHMLSIDDLDNIEISQDFKNSIAEKVKKIEFLNQTQKENLISKIITNEKAKIIQKKQS